MGYFRERRRARQAALAAAAQQQQQQREQQQHGAGMTAEEALVSEEARLAEEARMILSDGGMPPPPSELPGGGYDNNGDWSANNGDTSQAAAAEPTLEEITSNLSPAAEQKILALHYHFDVDQDGYLSYPELQALQRTTSGADMSVHEYTMICHALQCEPRRGISLDALRVTYATVEGSDANLDVDYDNVFGREGGGDGASDISPPHSAAAAAAAVDRSESEISAISNIDDTQHQQQPPTELPYEEKGARLELGDHVYKRRAAGLAQIHAIVVSMAPGEDGPLLLADFRGQNTIADEEEQFDVEEENNIVEDEDGEKEERGGGYDNYEKKVAEEDGGGEVNGDNKKAAAEGAGEEEPPDPTVERVQIICIEGKKNIRKWKKVRYGRASKLRSWFKRKRTQSSSVTATTTTASYSSVDGTSGTSMNGDTDGSTVAAALAAEGEKEQKRHPQQPSEDKKNKKKDASEEIPETDPGTLVVQRVNFLLENQHLIPPWHVLKSNSECLAVWCKTGRWSTYQVSGYLHTVFMGQAKTAATVAAAASSATVSVPAAGYMGWLGFTTQVSLLALHPWLIPAIAGYGIASIGVPMYILNRCGKMWAKTTIELNDDFWSRAPPQVFVDCIRRWSGLDVEE